MAYWSGHCSYEWPLQNLRSCTLIFEMPRGKRGGQKHKKHKQQPEKQCDADRKLLWPKKKQCDAFRKLLWPKKRCDAFRATRHDGQSPTSPSASLTPPRSLSPTPPRSARSLSRERRYLKYGYSTSQNRPRTPPKKLSTGGEKGGKGGQPFDKGGKGGQPFDTGGKGGQPFEERLPCISNSPPV